MAKAVIGRFFAVTSIILSGRVSAHTLKITTCASEHAETLNEGITFWFCRGGSYCDAADEVPLPSDSGIENVNSTVEIAVDLGYIPTTMEIKKSTDNEDWWCIATVVWEDGEDLLGEDGWLLLESETGLNGCIDGVGDGDVAGVDIACKREWRFFNLDSSSDYVYDIRVKACSGTSSGSVQAYFCSHASCNGTMGEEVEATLTLSSGEDGGWTHTELSSGFNPVAMRLSEVDENWCADEMTFNLFLVLSGPIYATDFEDSVNGVGSMIVQNIQANGMTSTPAPFAITPAPTSNPTHQPMGLPTTRAPAAAASTGEESDTRWLDAAWEVAVTIVGGVIMATIAGITTMACKRQRRRRGTRSGKTSRDGHPSSRQ